MDYYRFMTNFKEYIASSFINKKLHFKCQCLFPLDFVGTIKGYKIQGDEIVWKVDRDGKIIDIGINHPNMTVEEI